MLCCWWQLSRLPALLDMTWPAKQLTLCQLTLQSLFANVARLGDRKLARARLDVIELQTHGCSTPHTLSAQASTTLGNKPVVPFLMVTIKVKSHQALCQMSYSASRRVEGSNLAVAGFGSQRPPKQPHAPEASGDAYRTEGKPRSHGSGADFRAPLTPAGDGSLLGSRHVDLKGERVMPISAVSIPRLPANEKHYLPGVPTSRR